MKKRTRYFIFFITILAGVYFLMPTYKWYFKFKESDRNEARLEGDFLKEGVTDKVNLALKEMPFNESNYMDELQALNKVLKEELKTYNKANKADPIAIKKSFSYEEIKKIILDLKGKDKFVDSFLRTNLEDYYIKYFNDKKRIKDSIIKLGLDLQGGAYAVVTVNFDDPKVKAKLEQMIDQDKKDGKSLKKDLEELEKKYKDSIIENAVLKIGNRINKYGLSETSIQRLRGQDKIIINLPGVKEITELRQIIETVGVLEFKLVSEQGTSELIKIKQDADSKGDKIFDTNGKLLSEYKAILTERTGNPDLQALFVSNKDKWGNELQEREMLVVENEPLLGGNPKIVSATIEPDQFGKPAISFVLGDKEAKKWAEVTGANINKQVAIVLDDVILSAPVVRSQIPNGRSVIEYGSNPQETEINTLALILRSGSLNVPLEISEEHTVGASLGRDTIEKGLIAVFFGLIAVLVFMFIWYNVGGLIADLAMILNLLFLLSGLALFHGTLTLPGIAGIILTIGMAVDANVIIYERIKEEFRSGKTFKTAVNLGYDKAFWTIMDANITTFVAGIGLSLFGTGPIKGFAVTLCLGIVFSLFTALFVSRLIIDSFLFSAEFKSLRVFSLLRGK